MRGPTGLLVGVSLLAAVVVAGCAEGNDAGAEGEPRAGATAAAPDSTAPAPLPGAPRATTVAFADSEGPATSFGPTDSISVLIDLAQLTEAVEVNVTGEAVHETLPGTKGLTSEKLLRRGEDYEGAEYTMLIRKSAPGDGWEQGVYRMTVSVELVDRTGLYPSGTQYYELEFTVGS